jgi:hypothetical protein
LALSALRDAFLLHLDYEERELFPLLRGASAWGQVVATHAADEHHAQRATVSALIEDAAEGSGKRVAELVEEIGWFVKGLERDMEQEEARLLTRSALGDGSAIETSG